MPEFAEAVAAAAEGRPPGRTIILSQGEVAADYAEDELLLLGRAVRYAAVYDVELRVVVGDLG